MPNDPILHLLGLARKAGRLEIGEEPVGPGPGTRRPGVGALRSDEAANPNRRAADCGEAGNVLWLEVPYSKAELGFHLGRGSCAMLAITDAGFAAAVTEKLAARDPERYGPAAQQLRQKADRVLQRQKEKRQHEKNLQNGKKKPWAVPNPTQKKNAAPSEQRKGKGESSGAPEARSPRSGSPRPGQKHRPGPGGRKLSGTFRHKP